MLAVFSIKIIQHSCLPQERKYFTIFKSPNSFWDVSRLNLFNARQFLQPASIICSFFPCPFSFLTVFEKHFHGNCTRCSSNSLIISVSRGKITSLGSATALTAPVLAFSWEFRVYRLYSFFFFFLPWALIPFKSHCNFRMQSPLGSSDLHSQFWNVFGSKSIGDTQK